MIDNTEGILEAARVFGNLTRHKQIRDYLSQNKGMRNRYKYSEFTMYPAHVLWVFYAEIVIVIKRNSFETIFTGIAKVANLLECCVPLQSCHNVHFGEQHVSFFT